jgi:hypothetical protein
MLTTLNPHPALLAATLVEQGSHSAEEILITPAEGTPGAGLKEVTEYRYDEVQRHLCITVRSKSQHRRHIEQEVPEKSPLRAMLPLLEQEFSRWQIETTQREREHVLGLSPIQPSFFDLADVQDEAHQKILSFFLPYLSLIQGDLPLTEKCLQNALQQPVRLRLTSPKSRHEAGATIDRNCVGLDFIIGGDCESLAPCALVEIGPVPPEDLESFVPGGRQRQFLEKAMLPRLLPEGWEWEVRVRTSPEHSGFRIGGTTDEGEKIDSRIDIQSFVE